ncbi:MAG: transposase [Anaerolineae bacterium]
MPAPRARINISLDIDEALLRDGLEALVQVLIEVEISAVIAAAPHERSAHRLTYRNGYRRRTLATIYGAITCYIPKLRKGSFYPSFLEDFDQHQPRLLQALQTMLEQGIRLSTFEDLISQMDIPSAAPDIVADALERLHDVINRERYSRYSAGDFEGRQMLAISTHRLEPVAIEEGLPHIRSQLIVASFSLLDDSLIVLQRVRQALSDSADAISLAA